MNIATDTKFAVASSQVGAETRETGCDGTPSIKGVDGGNQMQAVEHATQEVECNLIVPGSDSDEEFTEERIPCFKCKGTQVNKKGLPCRKCNGTGQFNLKGFGTVIKMVKEEIETFCTESFKTLY
jgi:RecJ-like exonuclease